MGSRKRVGRQGERSGKGAQLGGRAGGSRWVEKGADVAGKRGVRLGELG